MFAFGCRITSPTTRGVVRDEVVLADELRRGARRGKKGACGYHNVVKVIVLGAGVIGTTSAWYLAQAGHEVTVVDRHDGAGMRPRSPTAARSPPATPSRGRSPSVVPKVLRWLGREDAPLLFRPRADLAQWIWGLRFLAECWPGRFEHNTRVLSGLAAYSRECLKALRGAPASATTSFRAASSTSPPGRPISKRSRITPRPWARSAQSARSEKRRGMPRARAGARRFGEPIVGGIYTPQDESGDAHKFTASSPALQRKGRAASCTARLIGARLASGEVPRRHAAAANASADAYVVALGSYSPLLLRTSASRIPVYPLKGYSITLPLGTRAAAAPSVSLTDEAHKIVISRLGNRLRAAGTARATGYDTA